MKLVPQFSIRLMLGITALAAGLFAIVGLAARGRGWAIGVSMGLAAIAIMLATGAALFGVLWVFSVVFSRFEGRRAARGGTALQGGATPFAPASPPTPFADTPIDAIVLDSAPAPVSPAVPHRGESATGGAP